MTKEVITKRYYFTEEELKNGLALKGDIEGVSGITDYEIKNDSRLKDFKVCITTTETIEDKVDESVFPPKRVMGRLNNE